MRVGTEWTLDGKPIWVKAWYEPADFDSGILRGTLTDWYYHEGGLNASKAIDAPKQLTENTELRDVLIDLAESTA